MRYRLRNVTESADTQARRLIESSGALSTQEQEQVLKYLAGFLNWNVTFVRVLAVLQLLLSSLYMCMLISGYTPVFAVLDDNLGEAGFPPSSALTTGDTAAIVVSAVLLALGGLCDLRVCRRSLNVDAVSLSGVGGDGERAPAAKPCRGPPAERLTRAPRHQYVLSLFALCPSVYWLYVMHVYHVQLKRHGGQSLVDVADNWMELVLALWQPVMHVVVGRAIASVVSGKKDLLHLAELRYQCDKL